MHSYCDQTLVLKLRLQLIGNKSNREMRKYDEVKHRATYLQKENTIEYAFYYPQSQTNPENLLKHHNKYIEIDCVSISHLSF